MGEILPGGVMGKLREVNVPDQLLTDIERRAKRSGVTVEEQVIRDLLRAQEQDVQENANDTLDAIRKERDQLASSGVYLTEQFLTEAKNWGRK